ncbi:hypothetical protein IIA79_04365 [bacterium]|nr:hypothetical protein [bacterium]
MEGNTEANLLYVDAGAEHVAIGGSTAAGADIILDDDGSAVFNEQGNDSDFRVEGDTDPNLIFADASSGRVGIGVDLSIENPVAKLHVQQGQSGASVVTASCVLAVQSNANTGDSSHINVLGGSSGNSGVFFGDVSNPAIAEWTTNSSTEESKFKSKTLFFECGQKVLRTTKTADYDVVAFDYYIGVDPSAGGFNINLPPAATAGAGRVYIIKNETSNTNTIEIVPDGSDEVEGEATPSINTAFGSLKIISRGVNSSSTSWVILP